MTEMERSEGDPLAMDVNATSFEAADGASMRFKIDTKGVQDAPPVAGTATRGANDDLKVELTAAGREDDRLRPRRPVSDPARRAPDRGGQGRRRRGAGARLRRLGHGRQDLRHPGGDRQRGDQAQRRREQRRPRSRTSAAGRSWCPISTRRRRTPPPEYTLSYDLYENGVSGSLKLDYGTFALRAHLQQARDPADPGLRASNVGRSVPPGRRSVGAEREAALDRPRAELVPQRGDRRLPRTSRGRPSPSIDRRRRRARRRREVGRGDADQPIGRSLRAARPAARGPRRTVAARAGSDRRPRAAAGAQAEVRQAQLQRDAARRQLRPCAGAPPPGRNGRAARASVPPGR